MLLTLLMIGFGILAINKGEFKITDSRKVKNSVSRFLGIALILGAAAVLIPQNGGYIQMIIFLTVIIIGLITSEKIESKE